MQDRSFLIGLLSRQGGSFNNFREHGASSGPPEPRTFTLRRTELFLGLAAFVSLAVILAFGWLIPAGRWGADEFFNFAGIRNHRFLYVAPRLLWSPRPFSEIIFGLYGLSCLQLGRPLIVPILGFLWIGLGMSIVPDARSSLPRAVSLVSIIALWVSGHPTGEMFFTPVVAIAYIPTLAAIAFITVRETVGHGLTSGSITVALIVAAWSSEAGAMIIVCLLPALAFRPTSDGKRLALIAMLAAVPVLLVVTFLRAAGHPVGFGAALSTLEHQWPMDFASLDGQRTVSSITAGLLTKLAFVLGSRWLLAPRAQPLLASGLVLGCGVIQLAALAQGGDCGCGRYETLRQCLYYLALLAICGAGRARFRPIPGAALMMSAVLLSFAWSYPSLEQDWSNRSQLIKATARTWNGSLEPGTSMVFHIGPPSHVVGMTNTWIEGTFNHSNGFWATDAVLDYFKKSSVTFKP